MFYKLQLELPGTSFEFLSEVIQFESIVRGRQGANLVDYRNGLVPLVRTTTPYQKPNQKISPQHYQIIDCIKQSSGLPDLKFMKCHFHIVISF